MGIRCADHVTPFYPQKLALTSPTGGGRSIGIVRSRTKATEFFFIHRFNLYQSSPSFFPLYIQPVYTSFWMMHFYIVSIFLVFLSIFFISSILQLIIPKLYLNTGTSSAPIAVIVFLAFSSDFSIILNLLLRLRWSRGSVLAFGTQVRGFKPGRSRRVFKGK